MSRFISYSIIAILLGCSTCSVLQYKCASNECGTTKTEHCGVSVQKSTIKLDNSLSSEGNCDNQTETPNTGCCCCSVGCCQFIVPEYNFVLHLPNQDYPTQPIGFSQFSPQSVIDAVWHPPAVNV
jgi:hypothetical protein